MKQPRPRSLSVMAAVALLGAALACGSSANHGSSAEAFTISPGASEAAPGEVIKFQVQAASNLSVAWAVAEPQGGTIDASGNYTAPAAEGTYHVVATMPGGSGATSTVNIRSRSTANVAISPHAVTVAAGASMTFTASVTNISSRVTWSVAEGVAGGTVSSEGVYVAPPTAGTYHVVATSVADPSQGDTASVTVTAPPATATGAVATSPATSAFNQLPSNGTTAWAPSAGDTAWVNVVDYGARGDGVNDDTGAFRSAAATGKQVFVPKPPSFYRLSGTVSLQNTIAGDGSMPLIKMVGANGDANHQILGYVNQQFAATVYVQGLTLDGQWDGTTTPAGEYAHCLIIAGSSNITVRYNVMRNPMGDCVMLGGDAGQGGSASPSHGIHVTDNTLDNPYRCGVAVIYASSYVIQGNTIGKYNTYVSAIDNEPNPDSVSSVSDGTITGNVFDCQHTASVMLYHFSYGYPSSGTAGGNISVTGNTGKFAAGYGFALVGNWLNVTNSGNVWN